MTTINVTTTSSTVAVTDSSKTTVVTVPQTSFITAIAVGPQGPAGPQGATGVPGPLNSGFTYTQASPALTWTINHNLGYAPIVRVFDSGSQEVEVDVSHLSVNTALIMFTASTAGFARLI